jgi:hypothetical protein
MAAMGPESAVAARLDGTSRGATFVGRRWCGMDELIEVNERAVDDIETQDAGSTFVLGSEGWEAADYLDPEDDWHLQPDGSYVSPDGTLRTWPAAGPEPV